MINMGNVGTLEITERLGKEICKLYGKNEFEKSIKDSKNKKNLTYNEKSYK